MEKLQASLMANRFNPQFIPSQVLKQLTTQPRRLIIYLLAILGACLLLIGGALEYNNINQKTSSSKSTSLTVSKEATVAGSLRVKSVKVDVEGAVVQPGIREIPYNYRIADVLNAAGGMSTKADRIYISKNINLAQVVTDGMKIYIPAQGETIATTTINSSVAKSKSTNSAVQAINLNTASSAELESLPGIGPVTAAKIIAARPYQNISELQTKKVVGPSVFAKIKDSIIAP